jgi:hypothetical protein
MSEGNNLLVNAARPRGVVEEDAASYEAMPTGVECDTALSKESYLACRFVRPVIFCRLRGVASNGGLQPGSLGFVPVYVVRVQGRTS